MTRHESPRGDDGETGPIRSDGGDSSGGRDWRGLAASVAFCELVGIVPGVLTADDVTTWYQTLERSALSPPDWVFAPVWTTLFAMMGVALHVVRRTETGRVRKSAALGLFGAQLLLNAGWTLVFFGRHSILGGLVVVVGLWVTLVGTILAFAVVNWRAALLLVPYLLWVSFAAVLNLDLWRLNR
jgi:tryptophan-rich sensory protein